MIVLVFIKLGSVAILSFSFHETNSFVNDLVISVLVELCCSFAYFLDTLDESVMVSVGIVGYHSHSSVDLDHLFPVGHLSRSIVFNCPELVRISVSS